MTTVNSLTVFLLIGNLQIEITADFWENLGIQYWSIESDYCVQHSLSERAIYSEPSMRLRTKARLTIIFLPTKARPRPDQGPTKQKL